MLKVGITGGMGSGKTTVCKIFETLGIPVYYADDRAKYLMKNDKELRQKIISIFGSNAYQNDNELNRSYIADIAFHDPEKLRKLNEAVHPAVFKDGDIWHKEQKDVPYTLKEAALLFESGGYKKLDKIITVTSPLELRIKRILKRDKTTREAVLARIKNQMPDEEKKAQSDFIIFNDEKQSLINQVLAIHHELLSPSKPL
jgi:dephospho-CoA kinase